MSYANGPRIVTDGLVLHLDAANRKSYPGSGSTWYDLSGQNNHGSINNCTFANGTCYFDGTNDYISCSHSSSLSISSQITIEYSVKPTWATNYTPIIGKRDSSNTNSENYLTWVGGDKLLDYMARPTSDRRPLFNGSSYFSANNWYIIQVVSNTSNTVYAYVNGQLKASSTSGGLGATNTSSFMIGAVPGTILGDGYIGYVKIHNKALTQNELLQNYNALKGRFEL
jgi:hypothetical protein